MLADKSPTLLFHSVLHFEAGIIERTGLKENGAAIGYASETETQMKEKGYHQAPQFMCSI